MDDAGRTELSLESRFDLAYNAAHALALVALRFRGYRSGSRYLVCNDLIALKQISARPQDVEDIKALKKLK